MEGRQWEGVEGEGRRGGRGGGTLLGVLDKKQWCIKSVVYTLIGELQCCRVCFSLPRSGRMTLQVFKKRNTCKK